MLFKFSNPVTAITHSKDEIATTVLNYIGLPAPKKCTFTRAMKEQFEDRLGVFGGNFLLYHYTTRNKELMLEFIANNVDSDTESYTPQDKSR